MAPASLKSLTLKPSRRSTTMRELTSNEIDMVSAGPSAVTPLALAGQCNISTSTSAPSMPGIFPAAAGAFLSNDPIAIVK
jgi:hypothetical protein